MEKGEKSGEKKKLLNKKRQNKTEQNRIPRPDYMEQNRTE